MDMNEDEIRLYESMANTDELLENVRTEVRNLQAQCAAYQRLLKGQQQILAAYRTSQRPPESAFELIASGYKALKQLGIQC